MVAIEIEIEIGPPVVHMRDVYHMTKPLYCCCSFPIGILLAIPTSAGYDHKQDYLISDAATHCVILRSQT